MRLPKELLSRLDDGSGGTQALFLMRGKGKYLKLFTQADFDRKIEKAKRLNPDNAKHYRLMQLMFKGAQTVQIDSADRINIPKVLAELAGLQDEAIISTFMDQVEIWSAEAYWADALAADAEEEDRLAEEIFGAEAAAPVLPATELAKTPPAE